MARSKNIIKSFNEFGGSMVDTTANREIKDGVNYFSGERGE